MSAERGAARERARLCCRRGRAARARGRGLSITRRARRAPALTREVVEGLADGARAQRAVRAREARAVRRVEALLPEADALVVRRAAPVAGCGRRGRRGGRGSQRGAGRRQGGGRRAGDRASGAVRERGASARCESARRARARRPSQHWFGHAAHAAASAESATTMRSDIPGGAGGGSRRVGGWAVSTRYFLALAREEASRFPLSARSPVAHRASSREERAGDREARPGRGSPEHEHANF